MLPDLKPLVEELSATANHFSNTSNPAERNHIISLANQIKTEVEEPFDRVNSYVQVMGEMGALRLFLDWDAFANIPSGPEGISYTELASKLGADERLVRRMAWMLAIKGILKPVGLDYVAHTKFSEHFARKDSWAAHFKLCYDKRNFVYCRWPDFFAKYGRKEPVNPTHDNPTSFAFGKEDKSLWDILEGDSLADFNTAMRLLSQARSPHGIFPSRWIAENAHLVAPDAALVVDVGGGRGQDLYRMRKECPDIPAERMVLQERAPVIEEVERLNPPEAEGVKKMAHDFFTEQPVKGALVYFFKRIMHDWSDKYCRQILGRTRDAMAPKSRVLIYDFIMPQPPTSTAAVLDLGMLNLGAGERTEEEWHDLVQSAGLQPVRIWRAPEGGENGVVECMRSWGHDG
ncbi:S-adenosyl-L-methionine-dependent methyltransferase [Macrophomina phaseolina]|uniref:S-adenosyl-L-methionine-dependent methyltransferase n=1 Tax=Macrophomina phaseolina TaxID=35725 RepID=A0ABQ8FSA0_9PEZI|nr:S-adenosyl-L-methionine-dependent methyltransferase [Macrophomina phaseolina]